MKTLNDKYMTDEETDDENGFLITRSPRWRNDRLSQLFYKLDKKYKKYSKSEKSRPLKPRKPGPFTQRKPPTNAPKWALIDKYMYHEVSSESVAESSESESPLTSIDGRAESTTTVTAGPVTVSIVILSSVFYFFLNIRLQLMYFKYQIILT